MSSKHKKTLAAIFAKRIRANIAWDDVVSLFEALGADVSPTSGSMFGFDLRGVTAIFHKPHPSPECPKTLVKRFRVFLKEVGIEP